jgi:hypothetical protein
LLDAPWEEPSLVMRLLLQRSRYEKVTLTPFVVVR